MSYRAFVRDNLRFLAFGFALNGASSFGQTYFVALFGAAIRDEFTLSHGGFGALYSAATLASGATLLWIGRAIDDVDLRRYAGRVVLGLAAACWLMALAPAVFVLAPALFAVRLTGQGLMTHTAMSSMARYFDAQRGRAMSLASLGRPVGEMVVPVATVWLVTALGWRTTWAVVGTLVAVLLWPFVRILLRGHDERHAALEARLADEAEPAEPARRRDRGIRRAALRDPVFWRALPAVLATPFLLTGVFFHQIHLSLSKGWTVEWFASGFVAYAVATVAASLAAGPFVDRFGARRLLRYVPVPLGLSLVVLAVSDHPAVAPLFLFGSGISMGTGMIVIGALWAELYGVTHVGSIRSMTSALMVFSTALAPVLAGALIDAGVDVMTLSLLGVAYVGTACAVAPSASRGRPEVPGLPRTR